MSALEGFEAKGLSYKLKQTQHTLRIYMDNALKSLELTTPQYAVLSQLELNPGISNAALARASFVTAQTMHGIISNLERDNLLSRKPDPLHGRIRRTELTKKGLKTVQQAHIIINKLEKTMTHKMSQKNKLLLSKLLFECIENLSAS